MAIRSDVIMTSVVVKFSDFIILSPGILFEEYFGCSVCMEKILYEDIYNKMLIFIVNIIL